MVLNFLESALKDGLNKAKILSIDFLVENGFPHSTHKKGVSLAISLLLN